jgi:hypothetical protein
MITVLTVLFLAQAQSLSSAAPIERPRPALEKSAEEVARDVAFFNALGLQEDGVVSAAASCGGPLSAELATYVVPRRVAGSSSDGQIDAANIFFWRGHLELADALTANNCRAEARVLYEKTLKLSAGPNQNQFIEWAKYGLSLLGR